MSEEINIITLGDILENIETEEKAFKFLNYIVNLQQENKRLKKELDLQFKDLMKRIQENNDEYLEEKNKLIKENYHYKKILTELENSHKDMAIEIPGHYVYDKIQELKEKYK